MQVTALLHTAARKAVADGLAVEAFMSAAYQAYLVASPELRDRIETAQLLQFTEHLRRAGRVGAA